MFLTYVSLYYVDRMAANLHSFLPLASAVTFVAGSIHLIERRGRDSQITPSRRIDISTLVESMPEATFVFDNSGHTVEVNKAAEKLLQVNRAELKRFSADVIARLLANTPEGMLKPEQMVVRRSLAGETIHEERRIVVPSSGVGVEVLLSANPIRNEEGEVVGAMVVVRDVTELSGLQRRMMETERHNAIGKMAAALAHDFNNVLQSISQAVAVLEIETNRAPEERNIILRMIRNAVNRGTEITASVRQFLKDGAPEAAPVDINTILEETIELTRPLWSVSRNVSLVRQFQPVGRVYFNAPELRRIVTNLVMNALEAMPSGGMLTIGCEQNQGNVCAFVEDTGEGISPEQQKKMFIPYFTTKQGGTGLGLANARRSIAAMGGRLTYTTVPGKGTRFQIELPAAENTANPSSRVA
ncbi:MAG TPA: ATP-binding protein [Terriglobales bacterium]|nr:ATP-binding protein [Terriglobales bacterium]